MFSHAVGNRVLTLTAKAWVPLPGPILAKTREYGPLTQVEIDFIQ